MMAHWFGEGEWVGEYTYDVYGYTEPVPFRMDLRLGWFGSVRGSVQDESDRGMPDQGVIKGRVRANGTISFVKLMPFRYVFRVNPRTGERLDERSQLVPGRHPPIYYRGQWDRTTGQVAGTWVLKLHRLQTGKWTARPSDRPA